MEELKQTIIDAVVEGQKRAYELGYCNTNGQQQLINGKDPNELLTREQVKDETGFGLGTVQDMFRDPELDAQRYTSPQVVSRRALYRYIDKKHDYLSKRS